MITTAYKVVQCTSGWSTKRQSYTAPPGIAVKYAKGKWAKAHHKSGLFVFDTLENAKRVTVCWPGFEIWECLCEDQMPTPKEVLSHPIALAFHTFWAGTKSDRARFFLQRPPEGTLLFKRIMLMKRTPQEGPES